MVARVITPVRKVLGNPSGRDFVVGDIHGCFDLVLRAMDKANFDQSRDRVLSVGDLIDRGPGSHRTAKFLSHPWVLAVRGNHEDMLLEIYQDGTPHPAVLQYMTAQNGFGWWLGASEETRSDILDAIGKLPLVMEVETHRGLVGLVHADVPAGMDWTSFKSALERGDEKTAHVALWGRDRLHQGDEAGVVGIGRLFVGHTPMVNRGPLKLGNVYAIDTGAVYGLREAEAGALTFADIATSTNILTSASNMAPPKDLVFAFEQAARDLRPFSPIGPPR